MTPEELELRDEILSVLFWLEGEGLSREVTPKELAVWLESGDRDLGPVLEGMTRDGFLDPGERPSSFGLSDLGRREGGRRFTEDFAEAGLTRQGHGACAEDCDCHTLGPEHCAEHGHAAHA